MVPTGDDGKTESLGEEGFEACGIGVVVLDKQLVEALLGDEAQSGQGAAKRSEQFRRRHLFGHKIN